MHKIPGLDSPLTVIACVAALVLLHVFPWASVVAADERPITAATSSQVRIPVFPSAPKEKAEGVEEMLESYIMLEDGSVLTFGDWIVGALNKDKAGHLMSDYDRRLFLGEMARAGVGVYGPLVDRTPGAYAAARRAFTIAPETTGQLVKRYARPLLCAFGCTPDTSLPLGMVSRTFMATTASGGEGPTALFRSQFDDWFAESLAISAADYRDLGVLRQQMKDAGLR